MYRLFIKRLLDIILSLITIVILIPAYILVSIIIKIKMGSPILFSQERIGKDEKPFKFFKYRSMTNEKDIDGNLLDETKRLTQFGTILRSTSLDELPELLLVLLGKMSIIGPRPLPTYYLPYFREDERVRHTVRGGLIPADTICGKSIITWDEQLKWDAFYAKNCSFAIDIKILLATFKVLLIRLREDYGSIDRPHLSEERSGVRDAASK